MRYVVLGWVCAVTTMAGCGDDDCCISDARVDGPGTPTDANLGLTEVALIPGTINRDLDLMFVIDDSPSMLDKQTNLKNSFAYFVQALESGGGLPNLHVGVITTDMGTRGEDDPTFGSSIGSGPGSCSGNGKDGLLQTNGSSLVTGKFIIDSNGTKNYTGTLAEAFSAIASAGTGGCGFEQPFASMKRGLQNVNNVGFLRETARLGIIVLSDEDDCSISHSTMLGSDTGSLGPLQSFRCTRFGVTCDVAGTTPDEMNMVGLKNGCRSNEQSAYLTNLSRYATLLNGFKADPRDVMFSAIVGGTGKVETELRTPPGGGTAINALAHVCTYAGATGQDEHADPAVRITQFASMVRRGSVSSVCNPNLQPVLSEMGQRMKTLVGAPCIDRTIAQPATCEVWDVVASGPEQWVPACSETTGLPCFAITADATICPAAQNLAVNVSRAFPASPDTWTSVRCQL